MSEELRTVNNLIPGQRYIVRVRAVNPFNTHSNWSDPIEFTANPDETIPGVPSGLSASAGVRTIILQWNANLESDFGHYEIHVSTTPGFTPGVTTLFAEAAPGTIWTVNKYYLGGVWVDLVPGTTYYLRMIAVDHSGNKSATSSEVSATTGFLLNSDIQASTITADKITTSVLNATITVAGTIRTASSGARMEMTSAGLSGYALDGVTKNLEYLNADGSLYLKGTIDASNLIGNNVITNDVVNNLRSGNYVVGEAGWVITGNGNVEFSSGVFRGDIIARTLTASLADTVLQNGTFEDILPVEVSAFSGGIVARDATQAHEGTESLKITSVATGVAVISKVQSVGVAGNNEVVSFNTPVTSGNLLVTAMVYNSHYANITAPAGWTAVVHQDGTTNGTTAIWYKIATSSEPASYIWATTSGSIYHFINMFEFSSNHAIPLDTSSSFASSTSVTSIQPGSITPAGPGELLVVCNKVDLATNSTALTAPGTVIDSGFTRVYGQTIGIGLGYKIKDTSDSTAENPTLSWPDAGNRAEVAMAAFKPAATSSPTIANTDWFPCHPYQGWEASCWVYPTVTGASQKMTLRIQFADSEQLVLTTINVATSDSASANSWQQLMTHLIAYAPTSAAYIRVSISAGVAPANGSIWYVDEIALQPAPTVTGAWRTQPSGARMSIGNPLRLEIFSGDPTELQPGYLETYAPVVGDDTGALITLQAPSLSSTKQARIMLGGSKADDTGSQMLIKADELYIAADGDIATGFSPQLNPEIHLPVVKYGATTWTKGNGVCNFLYNKLGKWVTFELYFAVGSTSNRNGGTGVLFFTYPVSLTPVVGSNIQIGSAALGDGGAILRYWPLRDAGAGTFCMTTEDGSNIYDGTLAWTTGHYIVGAGCYRVT